MESYSIFGQRMASEYSGKVTVKNTPPFREWLTKHHYVASEEDVCSVPIEVWVDAFQEGRAPRIYPRLTDHRLQHWVPTNVVTLYFV